MFLKYLPIAYQQKILLEKMTSLSGENKAVRRYLKMPLPSTHTPVEDIEYLALDFETTGLDARHEAILSIGYTIIREQKIRLRENRHSIIKINRPIPDESIVIHKITEERAAKGEHLHDEVNNLLNKMAGRVLLVHYAAIERGFLNSVCKQLFGFTLPLLIVDTLSLEYKYLKRTHQVIYNNQLRLFNLRKQYGLPRYKAHNALEDAIATAELFLAQVQSRQAAHSVMRLKEVLV